MRLTLAPLVRPTAALARLVILINVLHVREVTRLQAPTLVFANAKLDVQCVTPLLTPPVTPALKDGLRNQIINVCDA